MEGEDTRVKIINQCLHYLHFIRHVTVCKQEYMDHKLVAISPDQSHVVIDTFSFPSCCSCHIQRSTAWS